MVVVLLVLGRWSLRGVVLLTLGGDLCGDGSLANPFNVLFLAFCSYFDLARGELVLGDRAGVATFAPACLVASSVFAASEFRDFTASDGLSQSVPVFRDEERAKATPWCGRDDWRGSKSLRTSPPWSISQSVKGVTALQTS